jgi:hypothetical protein
MKGEMMKSMKSGMKGGSEVILLVIIPLLILIWFGVDESQKKDRYLDWLSKERISDPDDAEILADFRKKPMPKKFPNEILEGEMTVGDVKLDTTLRFMDDGTVEIQTERIGGVEPALFGKASFKGQVMSLEEGKGYLGLIPKDGIAISFTDDSRATIHQHDGEKVFMSSAAKVSEWEKKGIRI